MSRLPALALALAACTRAADAAPPAAVPPPQVNLASTPGEARAVFAGGCFWGVEAIFESLNGVKRATSGYAGGDEPNPSYTEVSSGDTGHAEVVLVVYDPAVISYGQLLHVFFSVAHDPTQKDRQGPDVGSQYRSAIFTTSEEQAKEARAYVADLTNQRVFPRPIVTQIEPLRAFFAAEDDHQDFVAKNPRQPYVVHHDLPKLAALKQRFPALIR